MLQLRIIPVLLLKDGGLSKSVKFKNFTYIGDPINAVRIFNEKEVDEIVLLDIDASKQNREPNFELIAEIGSEAFVPFAYGGGITKLSQVKRIMYAGAEKVILNTSFINNPSFISEVSEHIGSSSTVVSIDIKKDFWGKYHGFSHLTSKNFTDHPVALAQKAEKLGAGELFINSVDLDGTMSGYDLTIMKEISDNVSIPVVACGGAGKIEHFKDIVSKVNVDAVAAGSMFVFHGKHKAVLINYPNKEEINSIKKYE
jgi:imidazole glycerol-phosphate synthase subunit HisF